MEKKNVTLILLLSALAILLLSLQNPQYSNLFLYVALGISVLSAEITFLPDEVLNKQISLLSFESIIKQRHVFVSACKNVLKLLIFPVDRLGALAKLLSKFAKRTIGNVVVRISHLVRLFAKKARKFFKRLIKFIKKNVRKLQIKKKKKTRAKKEKTKKVSATKKTVTRKDEESWGELISWWIKTPVLPSTIFEWFISVLFVLLVTVFLYFVLDRFFAGHNGLDMFLVWSDI